MPLISDDPPRPAPQQPGKRPCHCFGEPPKDTVSRVWHKVQADWQAWQKRSLADDDIIRLILDGTVVRVRLDRKATSLSVLVALGVRRDGQKVLLALKNIGGESEAAWRQVLDSLGVCQEFRVEAGLVMRS